MSLHPVSARILSGSAPEPLCRAAARGAVPVPAGELIRLQVYLAAGAGAEIAEAARASLAERGADDLLEAASAEDCSPQVLDWISSHRQENADLMAVVVGHSNTPVEALLAMAREAGGDVLERILDNQVRLLEAPDVVAVLEANPGLSGAGRARLHDIRTEIERRKVRSDKEAAAAAAAAAEVDESPADTSAAATEGADSGLAGIAEEQGADGGFDDDPEEEGDLLVRIMNMTVPDKIALALKGGKEERSILIRDPIKVVAMSVMKSPKLTETEVETISGMRNVVEDVIRLISGNREWLRSYAIINALCKNPKTPVRKVLTLMSRLNNRDLKMLGADRNISEVVRTGARRIFVARTAPATRSYGKK